MTFLGQFIDRDLTDEVSPSADRIDVFHGSGGEGDSAGVVDG
jgi:hypothetical protein